MNKQDAADYLGVSVRTLENMMKPEHPNRVRFAYVKGKTRDVADFEQDELDRAKANMPSAQAPLVEGAIVDEVVNSEISQPRNSETAQLAKVAIPQTPNFARAQFFVVPVEAMDTLFERVGQSTPLQELAAKLNLTVKEAGLYTGRSEKDIREAIKSGDLDQVKMARGAVGVKRSQLEKWNG